MIRTWTRLSCLSLLWVAGLQAQAPLKWWIDNHQPNDVLLCLYSQKRKIHEFVVRKSYADLYPIDPRTDWVEAHEVTGEHHRTMFYFQRPQWGGIARSPVPDEFNAAKQVGTPFTTVLTFIPDIGCASIVNVKDNSEGSGAKDTCAWKVENRTRYDLILKTFRNYKPIGDFTIPDGFSGTIPVLSGTEWVEAYKADAKGHPTLRVPIVKAPQFIGTRPPPDEFNASKQIQSRKTASLLFMGSAATIKIEPAGTQHYIGPREPFD